MAGIMDTEFILQCYHNIRIGGLPCVLPKECALTAMLAERLERPHAHSFASFVPQNSWSPERTRQYNLRNAASPLYPFSMSSAFDRPPQPIATLEALLRLGSGIAGDRETAPNLLLNFEEGSLTHSLSRLSSGACYWAR